jgi:Domain of unknown function (DUF4214)
MTFVDKDLSILCLTGMIVLIGSPMAEAQSHEDSQKRSFADLLTRRERTSRIESARSLAHASRVANHTERATSPARSTGAIPRNAPSNSPVFARVSPLSAGVNGVSPATPYVNSGYGAGRDAFVESLYPQILGRSPTQSELDYWSKSLARGISANAVADRIWNSQEHRALVRMNEAPGIPLRKAYQTAYAYGKAHRN